jgi:hypothetical protein
MSEITVEELIKELEIFNPKDTICFGPDKHFSFSRTKDRGGVVQIEFVEQPGSEYTLLPRHKNNNLA